MNAFSIGTSTATPQRGSKLTITVSTAEPLESGIFVYITETGLSRWGVTLTKVNSTTWKATVSLKTGGPAGTVQLYAKGIDIDGRTQTTTRTCP